MTPEAAQFLIDDARAAIARDPAHGTGWQRLYEMARLPGTAAAAAAAREWSFRLGLTDPVARFLRADCWLGLDARPDPAVLRELAAALLQPPCATPLRLQAFGYRAWAQFISQSMGLGDLKTWGERVLLAPQQRVIAAALPDVPVRVPDRLARVAVVASHLGSIDHAPTALALQHARLFAEQGCAVLLASPLDGHFPEAERYLGISAAIRAPGLDAAGWPAVLPTSVRTEVGWPLASPIARWRSIIEAVARFDPDLVLVVGFLSAGAWRLAAARPTLGLNVHALAPLYPTDAWLAGDGALREPWRDLPPTRGIDYPWRVAGPSPTPPRARSSLGLADDAVVVVTSAIRLQNEATPAWAAAVLARVAAVEGARWLLVAAPQQRPEWMAHPLIMHVPYDADLPSLLAACDLMLNPPRLGGGTSVALAMAVGLPVIAVAGSDGGDKLGPHAVVGETEALALLDELLAGRAARRSLGASLAERFRTRLDLNGAGPALMAAGEAAQALFKMRASSVS